MKIASPARLLSSLLFSLTLFGLVLAAPPSTPPQDLSDLNEAYTRHTTSQLSRAAHMDRTLPVYTALREEMRTHFNRLSSLHTHGHSETLSKINDLRLAGYRFGKDVDPGLHVPFGTVWEFDRFGPYPATRLARAAQGEKGEQEKLKVEVENALDALDRQTMVEAKMSGRARMVYTDDTMLLWNAIKYHRGRLEEGLKGVGEGLTKVRL